MEREIKDTYAKAQLDGTSNELQSAATNAASEPLKLSFGWSQTDVDQDYTSKNTVNINNTNTNGQALAAFFNQGGANTLVLGIAFIGISILVAFGVAARLKGGAKNKANKVNQRVVVKK